MSIEAQDVINAVRKYIYDQHPGGTNLEVVTAGVHQESDWWYVPVVPNFQPPKRYEYYEALAYMENELLKSDDLTVLFVPVSPEVAAAASV